MDSQENSITQASDFRPAATEAPLPYAELPPLVIAVRDTARSRLQLCMTQLFDNCDRAFVELAKNATSNTEQTGFFEAPKQILSQQTEVSRRFYARFERNFIELERFEQTPSPTQNDISADSLDLVAQEDMERTVAIAKLVTRNRIDNREELYNLECRLDSLLDNITIEPSNNPLDPAQLCAAFEYATESIELSAPSRVMLLQQFDAIISTHYPPLLSAANKLLLDAGVLPVISHALRKAPNKTDIEPSAIAAPDKPSLQADEAPVEFSRQFSELSQLLNSVRELAVAGKLGFPLFMSRGRGPALERDELHSLLNELQQTTRQEHSNSDLFQPQPDLRSLLESTLHQRENSGKTSKVGKSDEDVINLIAMFFDFVLDDKQLSIQVQALVSRLQIPVLKIALRDRRFFSSAKHPVRRLINEIVAVGVGLNEKDENNRDALVEKLTDVVHDIQANYEDDESVFLSSLELLRTLRLREEQKADKVAKRSSQAAEAEAKTQHAKALIEQLVLERLIDIEVPQVVQNFAIGEWQQVLLLARLKHGNESAEWLHALQTLDDLIWSSLRHDDEKSQHRLHQMLPGLQAALLELLGTVKPSMEEAQSSLVAITDLQKNLQQPAQVDIERVTLNHQQQETLQAESDTEKPWREMTAVERQQMQYQALTYDFIKKADDMPIGSWLLFSKPTSNNIAASNTIRCKLAAKVEANDLFLFVDRLGFKALLKSRRDFAQDLQEGRARLVIQDRFFDRMMNKVSAQLHSRSVAVPNSYETA